MYELNVPAMFIFSLLREDKKKKNIGGNGEKLVDFFCPVQLMLKSLIVMLRSFNNCKDTVENLVDCIFVLL